MTKQATTPTRTPINPLIILLALFFLSACSSPNEANTPPPDAQEFDASNTDTDTNHDTTHNTPEDTDQNTQDDATQDTTQDATQNDTTPDNRCDTDCGHGTCIKVDGIDTCECNPGYHAEDLYCRARADACQGEDCPMSVQDWQALFDESHVTPRSASQNCDLLSRSGGESQEHYFFGYCIDGLTSIWRATGDNTYLDEAFKLIKNTIDTTHVDPNGRRYWKGPKGTIGYGHALWDSFYLRFVTTLLRIMHAHDDLLQHEQFATHYEEVLKFVREVWDFWEADGLHNLYRSRTHMASHWARMGMDLYLITGEERYKEVFDNISHGTMFGYPSNLREQFQPNPTHPDAYVWAGVWGNSPEQSVQDTSHAGALIAFIHEATLAGQYWTQADLDALSATLLKVIWDPALDGAYHFYVDGTDQTDGDYPGPQGLPGGRLGGKMHEWLHLGRHRPDIQARIETDYIADPTRRNTRSYAYQIYGIGALNARVIADGKPYY